MEELAETPTELTDRVELLDAVRDTLSDEVPALVEQSELNYRKTNPTRRAKRASARRPRPSTDWTARCSTE